MKPINVARIFMCVFLIVLSLLSILAGLRQHWLMLGSFSAGFAITTIIWWGVLTALKIDACTRRLEQLISKDKDDRASREQSGE